jgi:hypothetical protein
LRWRRHLSSIGVISSSFNLPFIILYNGDEKEEREEREERDGWRKMRKRIE